MERPQDSEVAGEVSEQSPPVPLFDEQEARAARPVVRLVEGEDNLAPARPALKDAAPTRQGGRQEGRQNLLTLVLASALLGGLAGGAGLYFVEKQRDKPSPINATPSPAAGVSAAAPSTVPMSNPEAPAASATVSYKSDDPATRRAPVEKAGDESAALPETSAPSTKVVKPKETSHREAEAIHLEAAHAEVEHREAARKESEHREAEPAVVRRDRERESRDRVAAGKPVGTDRAQREPPKGDSVARSRERTTPRDSGRPRRAASRDNRARERELTGVDRVRSIFEGTPPR
ncbi:MAG: hypothetical protein QOJ76_1019 [Acidobacteriota bacterium]|nr:hypothetical protein [Acidobacteriota bacterium]